MTSSEVVSIIGTVLVVFIGAYTLISSFRANQAQAKARKEAVDAAAYMRAKEIYEAALTTVRGELQSVREDLANCRGELLDARTDMHRLRESNEELRRELAAIRTQPG